jgi:hypothetical protein
MKDDSEDSLEIVTQDFKITLEVVKNNDKHSLLIQVSQDNFRTEVIFKRIQQIAASVRG